MRLLALVSATCAVAAFILSMLTIFAGSKQNFLESYDMLTLNVTKLGQNFLESHRTESDADDDEDSILSAFGDTAGKVGDKIGDKIDDVKADLQNGAIDKINEQIGNITRRLGTHDFYSVHLMNYCEGYYEAPLVNASDYNSGKNLTYCSPRRAGFDFKPKEILQEELNNSTLGDEVSLEDLQYPDEIDDAIKAANTLLKAMFVIYCIGAALSALAIVTGVVGFFQNGRAGDACNIVTNALAFIALGIASAIATAIIVKAVDAINDKGEEIGLAAYKGTKFLTLTWVATALMFLATVIYCVKFCLPGHGRSRKRALREKGTY